MGRVCVALAALFCLTGLVSANSRLSGTAGETRAKNGGDGGVSIAATGDHSLKWFPVVSTADGGDCRATCAAQRLFPVPVAANATLCALKYFPGQQTPVFYRDQMLSGSKADDQGCYYVSDSGARGYMRSTDPTRSTYLCGCARGGTTSWRTTTQGCPADTLNTYATCRYNVDGLQWAGWLSSSGRCIFATTTTTYSAASGFQLLCDQKDTKPVYRTGRVTWHAVANNDCFATCKAARKEAVGTGTPGTSLCTDAVSRGFTFPSTYSSRSLPWLPAQGCFLADAASPKRECPLTNFYHCGCQDPAKPTVWKSVGRNMRCIRPVKLPNQANSIEGPVFQPFGEMVTVCRAQLQGGQQVIGFYDGGNECRTLKYNSKTCAGDSFVGPDPATPKFDLLCEG